MSDTRGTDSSAMIRALELRLAGLDAVVSHQLETLAEQRDLVAQLALAQGEIANLLARVIIAILRQEQSARGGGTHQPLFTALIEGGERAQQLGAFVLELARKAADDPR